MASLNETIAALDRLPALPATTIQLISMLAGEGRDTDLHEVEKIVSRDEAVAASVLRRANSAAFGMRGRVAGISDAIRRLGTRELCRIALETQTSGLLANAGRSYGLRRGSLSQSALGGAVAADALATVLEVIAKGVKKDKAGVQLIGFGTFKVSARKARKGRNPKTGAAMNIKASKSVRFTPSSVLKKSL